MWSVISLVHTFFVFVTDDRKSRYFIGDRLNWDEHSHDGRAVRQQCKPLEVCSNKSAIICQSPKVPFLNTWSLVLKKWSLSLCNWLFFNLSWLNVVFIFKQKCARASCDLLAYLLLIQKRFDKCKATLLEHFANKPKTDWHFSTVWTMDTFQQCSAQLCR